MLKNYFITAINNLLKNKLYSAINIIGLAVGLAAFLLIALYVQNELSYDKHWEKADLIYRVNVGMYSDDGSVILNSAISPLALRALIKYFPDDIELGTRIDRVTSNGDIQIGETRYPGSISHVDKEFINIFPVEVIKGNLKNTFQGPGNIALSEESAMQYFGDKNPIGEVITFISGPSNTKQYKVSAVYRPISSKTVLNVPSFSLLDEVKNQLAWVAISHETYIRFKETADIDKIVNRLPDFIDKSMSAPFFTTLLEPGKKLSDVYVYSLQKISDIYFNPLSFPKNLPKKIGNKTVITVFSVISLLILIIGCINFVILTTAKATPRAREVAMRKVVGARFKQLFIQFLGESLLLVLIAFLFAVAITELALPYFELLVNSELTVPYTSPAIYLYSSLLILLVGLLGGLYPAFILSRLSPTQALKANQTTEAGSSFKLRNVLVVFQFAASIALIIATVVAYFQLMYSSKHDPGFNPERLLIVEDIERKKIKILQQEMLKLPSVSNVALSTLQPKLGGGSYTTLGLRRKKNNLQASQELIFNEMLVDYNFFKTYEISLLSGRYFTPGMDQEEPARIFTIPPASDYNKVKNGKIIINLEAARQLGYASADEAVGKIVESGDPGTPGYSEITIIGVVADSQFRDLRLKPKPEIYRLIPDSTFFLAVKYKGDYQTVVEEVQHVWQSIVGDIPFRDSNVKQNLAATFSQEKKESRVLVSFALLSIIIACMGLFGMAAFTVERRVKEIGLRKVMGAKVKDILKLLGWQFLKPVLISNIIAWPIAIFAMQSWLERFPYRFNPLFMIPICLGSGLIALAIAWLTVASNTTRVAKSNPIHALRYE